VGGVKINLVVPASGALGTPINMNADTSKVGDSNIVMSSNDRTVVFATGDDYSGHVVQEGKPNQYDDSAAGFITNATPDNKIIGVKLDTSGRAVSYWSNGKLYYVSAISRVGNSLISSESFLSGNNSQVHKDASGKLNAAMTLEEAKAVLEPGEYGSVEVLPGKWLWAYKTGDPSEGTVLDGQGLVNALQNAGVVMTPEDIEKTINQKEFIAKGAVGINAIYEDHTKIGIATSEINGMITSGHTVLPSSSSQVPGAIVIIYKDKDTGENITSSSDTGTYGEVSGYSTADKIKELEAKGYTLVSDGYKAASPVKYGYLTELDKNTYVVEFTHAKNPLEDETKTVNEVIHYYVDGTTKQVSDDHNDSVTFTRTVEEDLVLKNKGDENYLIYGEWVAKDDDVIFDKTALPELPGYTLKSDDSNTATEDKTVDAADLDNEELTLDEINKKYEFVVYYTADQQNVVYNIIDDDTETELESNVNFETGDTDTDLTKTQKDLDAIIKGYTDQGYEVVTADPVPPKFDNETGKDQIINIHLKHHLTTTTETKDVDETIHYVYEDSSKATDDKTDKVTFTRDTITDDVTKEVVRQSEWIAKDDDAAFDEKVSPEIDGYTPDKASIDEVTGLTVASDDVVETVTYKKDEKPAEPTGNGDNNTPPADTSSPTPTQQTPTPTPVAKPATAAAPAQKGSILPSTGEERTAVAVVGGFMVAAASVIGLLIHLKRKKQ
jgi:LPXTG-motif cell wall-anchored protein